jgi:hypothetical protein
MSDITGIWFDEWADIEAKRLTSEVFAGIDFGQGDVALLYWYDDAGKHHVAGITDFKLSQEPPLDSLKHWGDLLADIKHVDISGELRLKLNKAQEEAYLKAYFDPPPEPKAEISEAKQPYDFQRHNRVRKRK